MSNSNKSFLMDFKTSFLLQMKLLLHSKATIVLLVFSILLSILLMQSLNKSAEEKSNIIIGMVNNDEASVLSKALIEKLNANDAFHLVLGEFNKLRGEFQTGNLNYLFVIEKGYEEKIQAGDAKGVISAYYKEDDRTIALLTELIAGEMMESLLNNKGAILYERVPADWGTKYTKQDYFNYVKEIRNNNDFNFQFTTTYEPALGNQIQNNSLNNSLIYRAIICGIFSIILCFFLLFTGITGPMEYEQKIKKRKRVTLLCTGSEFTGTLAATLAICIIPCLSFSAIFCYYESSMKHLGKLFAITIVFTLFYTILFYLIGCMTQSITGYQLTGTIVILSVGILSFLNILQHLLGIRMPDITNYLPNRIFIDRILKTILGI